MSDTEVSKISNMCGVPLIGDIEDDFLISTSQKIERFENNYYSVISGIKAWAENVVEGTYGTISLGVKYIDEILNPAIYDMFQNIGFVKNIRNPHVELIRNKINIITDDAENLLSSDNILLDITSKIVNDVKRMFGSLNKSNAIDIFLTTDKEVPDWEEFVVSVLVDETDFSKIIEYWDMIEKEAEKRIREVKEFRRSEISHIEDIDKNLVIRVDSLENV